MDDVIQDGLISLVLAILLSLCENQLVFCFLIFEGIWAGRVNGKAGKRNNQVSLLVNTLQWLNYPKLFEKYAIDEEILRPWPCLTK